jgi:hypothetical protein
MRKRQPATGHRSRTGLAWQTGWANVYSLLSMSRGTRGTRARAELFRVGGAALAVGCAVTTRHKPVQGYRQADGERRRKEWGPATSGYGQSDENYATR